MYFSLNLEQLDSSLLNEIQVNSEHIPWCQYKTRKTSGYAGWKGIFTQMSWVLNRWLFKTRNNRGRRIITALSLGNRRGFSQQAARYLMFDNSRTEQEAFALVRAQKKVGCCMTFDYPNTKVIRHWKPPPATGSQRFHDWLTRLRIAFWKSWRRLIFTTQCDCFLSTSASSCVSWANSVLKPSYPQVLWITFGHARLKPLNCHRKFELTSSTVWFWVNIFATMLLQRANSPFAEFVW